MCGYMMWRRYTASVVRIRAMNCAQAASLIKTYFRDRLSAPSGWGLAFRRFSAVPAGGPPGSRDLRGSFTLLEEHGGGRVTAWLSVGARSAPPPTPPLPGAVRFGCRTHSSICS